MQEARQLSLSRGVLAPPSYPSPQRRVQPEPAQKGRKVKLFIILFAAFLLCLVVVAQYSSLVITSYRLGDYRTQLSTLKEETKELELQVAALSSVARLDQIAREELAMVEPELSQLRIVTAQRKAGQHPGE